MPKDPTPKQNDILDEIKAVDRAIRAQTLARILTQIKEKAKKVLELKEEVNALLEATGLSTEDIKRVIDFVNSLDEVQLTDSEKKEIRTDARSVVKNEKKTAEKKINESPQINFSQISPYKQVQNMAQSNMINAVGHTWVGNSADKPDYQVFMDNSSVVDFTDGRKSLSLKI